MQPPFPAGTISADSHVNEPRDLWSKNLPARFREQAMRGIEHRGDGGWELVLDGSHLGKAGMDEEERLRTSQPSFRLEVMREEGIVGECIFPTIGLYVWALQDPDGVKYSCRVYNEWVADQLQAVSPRFRCAGLVPVGDVEDAIAEVRFIAEAGLAAVMLPTVADPTYNHPKWEPLWSAIAETRLPVVMHQGTGHSMIWYRGPGATVANLVSTQSVGPRTAVMLATSGVLDRHPDLHVVFVEYNGAWLSWIMQTADFYTTSFDRYGTTDKMSSSRLAAPGRRTPKPVIDPKTPEPPSFYIKRQIHATFQDDPVALHNVPLTGPDCLLWGSDYPHEEGTYPHSRETVSRLVAGLSEDDARKIFRDTAARLFDFSPEVLAVPA